MAKKMMNLIEPHTNLMECKVCGSRHYANIRPGGGFYRGSWQCQHRDDEEHHAWLRPPALPWRTSP